MQENILRNSNVTKLYIEFPDGKNYKRKELVAVKYIDNKSCYFSRPTPTSQFTKPKWRTKANIIVYTPDGVYKTTVIIRDVDFSLNGVLYQLDLPKNWEFKQLRAGSRKKVKLPLTIKFTVVKWVKTYSGFEEAECLGNVEVWANYGGTAPALNTYKNDRRLRELFSNSIQYQKLGVTDGNGELELNLVRKSLPKGFFFRPVGYGNKVKIGYMDVTEVMQQSEGDYNKRQFRMKMYTEE